MKKIYSIVTGILLTASVLAQAPQKMSYQAVIRNSSNALVTSTAVGMKISVLQGAASGTAVYVETQNPTTNANGLVSLEIGNGTEVTGTFAGINWANGPYFIKTETDPMGGTNYTIAGTNELLSVPYALFSGNGIQSGTTPGQMNYWNGSAWVTVDPGVTGQTLTFCEGVPTWGNCIPHVTNPTTGKIWMDRNLGASQVATSSSDAASYGDLYQWGRGADGHQLRTSTTTTTRSSSDIPGNAYFISAPNSPYNWRSTENTNLWQGVNGINNPCPVGYRLPSDTELEIEHSNWNAQNAVGAFSSPLKLPLAGSRSNMGDLSLFGIYGFYWSSSLSGNKPRYLYFNSSLVNINDFDQANGFSVRCIKD